MLLNQLLVPKGHRRRAAAAAMKRASRSCCAVNLRRIDLHVAARESIGETRRSRRRRSRRREAVRHGLRPESTGLSRRYSVRRNRRYLHRAASRRRGVTIYDRDRRADQEFLVDRLEELAAHRCGRWLGSDRQTESRHADRADGASEVCGCHRATSRCWVRPRGLLQPAGAKGLEVPAETTGFAAYSRASGVSLIANLLEHNGERRHDFVDVVVDSTEPGQTLLDWLEDGPACHGLRSVAVEDRSRPAARSSTDRCRRFRRGRSIGRRRGDGPRRLEASRGRRHVIDELLEQSSTST